MSGSKPLHRPECIIYGVLGRCAVRRALAKTPAAVLCLQSARRIWPEQAEGGPEWWTGAGWLCRRRVHHGPMASQAGTGGHRLSEQAAGASRQRSGGSHNGTRLGGWSPSSGQVRRRFAVTFHFHAGAGWSRLEPHSHVRRGGEGLPESRWTTSGAVAA